MKRFKFTFRWEADLGDLVSLKDDNDGIRFFLLVIDRFSKFMFLEVLKDKSAKEVTSKFKTIIEKSDRICKNLQTDDGREFKNTTFTAFTKSKKINHYSSFSITKASMAERSLRTLKGIFFSIKFFNIFYLEYY